MIIVKVYKKNHWKGLSLILAGLFREASLLTLLPNKVIAFLKGFQNQTQKYYGMPN